MANFPRNKPHLNICTAGHDGNGKTTLTKAIQKVMRLQSYHFEESPIQHRFTQYETANQLSYSLMDAPNLESMLIGSVGMDGAIMVVNAPDDTKPYPYNHFRLLTYGPYIPAMVVFMNQIDLLVDKDLQDVVELEIREMLERLRVRP